MKPFKNILLVAPLDKQITRHGRELMTTAQSRMTLMSVVPQVESPQVKTKDGSEIDLQSLLQDEVAIELEQTAKTLKSDGVRVKTVVASGKHDFIEIINQVQSKKHDLVMMLADGVSSLREQLFGTLSMHLMRKCPSAVWVVKPSRRRKLRNVFAAVDPDPEDKLRDDLNVEILKRAASVAQRNGASLHVIHAWTALGQDVTRSRRWMSKTEIRLYVDKVRETHRKNLNRLIEKHGDGSEIVHLLNGRSWAVIPSTVEKLKGDLLVMGTVCRTGVPGFFIGNTAEAILNQVNCSVLTVKPKGFTSPV
jgi:nucleotide-binding universal stress UspA family protein